MGLISVSETSQASAQCGAGWFTGRAGVLSKSGDSARATSRRATVSSHVLPTEGPWRISEGAMNAAPQNEISPITPCPLSAV